MKLLKAYSPIGRSRRLIVLIPFLAALAVSCTWTDKDGDQSSDNDKVSEAKDMRYTRQAAMNIYGYQPLRALDILDSAVIVGNLSEVRAELSKARIYSMTIMHNQIDSLLGGPENVRLDSANSICERFLNHDSIKENLRLKYDALEILVYTTRQQDNTLEWMRRSNELIDVCHQIGEEAELDALRTEAELGAALYMLGKQEQGMEKLDSVISLLNTSHLFEEDKMTFSELDVLIVALKRKIVVLGSHDKYAETLPLARHIIELLNEYEKNPDPFHDGSHREPSNETKRADYINFYRNQAQNFITAAYVSLSENNSMMEAFGRIEQGVREATAREHIARYNALQHQMEAERQQTKARRAVVTAVGIGILALLLFIIAIVVIINNRTTKRRNLLLAQRISDAIKYKKMYFEERRAQAPSAAPDTDTVTDEELFQYISDVIVRECLFLDPRFERQTIMDRFQLTKERVGAIFSKGSDYAKLNSYIQQLRLEYSAKILVEQPDKNIVQIAADSGFSSSTYFSNCFRQHFGMSPSDYRKNAMSKEDDKDAL